MFAENIEARFGNALRSKAEAKTTLHEIMHDLPDDRKQAAIHCCLVGASASAPGKGFHDNQRLRFAQTGLLALQIVAVFCRLVTVFGGEPGRSHYIIPRFHHGRGLKLKKK